MSVKELGHSYCSLVVFPKVPDGAVDGGVCQQEHSFLFHPLDMDRITNERDNRLQIKTLMLIHNKVYLEIHHHHLSSGLLMCPVAECIWDGLVVLIDRSKSIIV